MLPKCLEFPVMSESGMEALLFWGLAVVETLFLAIRIFHLTDDSAQGLNLSILNEK